MPDGLQRRAAPRIRLLAPAEYHGCEASGTGMTWDISASGLRIEDVSTRLEDGDGVRVRCSFFFVGSFDVELKGSVVRQTETGFALQFLDLGTGQLRLLDALLPYAVLN